MAAIAHKQLSKPHGLVRSPDGRARVKSPAAPSTAAESPPVESIRAIPRLA